MLIDHPAVEIAWATSRRPAPIEEFHPTLYGNGIRLIHPDDTSECDVVFMALPTAPSVGVAEQFIETGAKVIDFGSAFRLNDTDTWERVYKMPHPSWSLAEKTVCGLSELHHDEIAGARLIANPGCFSCASIPGLAPMIVAGLVDPQHLSVGQDEQRGRPHGG